MGTRRNSIAIALVMLVAGCSASSPEASTTEQQAAPTSIPEPTAAAEPTATPAPTPTPTPTPIPCALEPRNEVITKSPMSPGGSGFALDVEEAPWHEASPVQLPEQYEQLASDWNALFEYCDDVWTCSMYVPTIAFEDGYRLERGVTAITSNTRFEFTFADDENDQNITVRASQLGADFNGGLLAHRGQNVDDALYTDGSGVSYASTPTIYYPGEQCIYEVIVGAGGRADQVEIVASMRLVEGTTAGTTVLGLLPGPPEFSPGPSGAVDDFCVPADEDTDFVRFAPDWRVGETRVLEAVVDGGFGFDTTSRITITVEARGNRSHTIRWIEELDPFDLAVLVDSTPEELDLDLAYFLNDYQYELDEFGLVTLLNAGDALTAAVARLDHVIARSDAAGVDATPLREERGFVDTISLEDFAFTATAALEMYHTVHGLTLDVGVEDTFEVDIFEDDPTASVMMEFRSALVQPVDTDGCIRYEDIASADGEALLAFLDDVSVAAGDPSVPSDFIDTAILEYRTIVQIDAESMWPRSIISTTYAADTIEQVDLTLTFVDVTPVAPSADR